MTSRIRLKPLHKEEKLKIKMFLPKQTDQKEINNEHLDNQMITIDDKSSDSSKESIGHEEFKKKTTYSIQKIINTARVGMNYILYIYKNCRGSSKST